MHEYLALDIAIRRPNKNSILIKFDNIFGVKEMENNGIHSIIMQ